MITFKKVTKKYKDDFTALDDVSLEIKDGEFVSLVGAAGAGKSTLIKMLIKEEVPSSGQVIIDGMDLADVANREIPFLRRKIGTIFQDFKLLDSKTAFENVAFALEVSGVHEEEIKEDTTQVLAIVGLSDKHRNFPKEMSGGEKQRLAIARALIHRPKIILADEPTGNLDMVNSYEVIKLLWKINEIGTTVILATHNREIVNTIGRRVVTLEQGKLVRDQAEGGKYII
ncbi:MAG: Cell division ATP-binding protein FtsE [Candidatus Woesebacteria bacterium GW2011_GWA1_41_13b]|uniref:Cell division ATP-binding protein FtsE n=1 Tax=Candidatus Woesebacteria bacterium GW2011_GWA1_41_13b TaxID=1618555 RepID=A0A0G0UQ54_9BACT|nr:MAG: Cell division ATP-binding protein FtsE [Candidatus Woesebacteria bacterium GW2011_GWA1_41_13b]HXK35769.1 cell division ATP-binding protein FtsE [Candidatus Paceibacterota bacterium]